MFTAFFSLSILPVLSLVVLTVNCHFTRLVSLAFCVLHSLALYLTSLSLSLGLALLSTAGRHHNRRAQVA